jgi:iron complex outermembrane recepter protein
MTRFSDVVPASRIALPTHARPATDATRDDIAPRNTLMSQSKTLSLAAAVSAAMLAAIAASPARAQDQPATADQGEAQQIQEVVVTGSRIASPNGTSASPIQVVSSQDIQITGKTDISDILYQMPQLSNNQVGQDFSNRTSGLTTPGGLSTADLRGLGPNRTLVLVDGIRLGQGSPQTAISAPAPDLDQIPTALIERVEVLTGGASSVYGSDAIAGVVNFIMKKNFQGIEVDGQWGGNWHDNRSKFMEDRLATFVPKTTALTGDKFDGQNRNFSIVMGTNFSEGAGNVTGYFNYEHMDPVAGSDRDIGQCQLTEQFDADGNVNGSQCIGSSNANRFTPGTGPNKGTRYAVMGNQFVPWSPTLPSAVPTEFNSQPFIYIQREDDRYMAGFMAHDDLTDAIKPYMSFNFMNDQTHQVVAPAAAFTTGNPNTGGPYFVNCGNPYLSAQEQGIMGCTPAQITAPDQTNPANQVPFTIGRRNVEGGPRASDYEHMNYRAVLGLKGNLGDAWNYDAYGQYYYVNFRTINTNYLSYANIDNALLATRDPTGAVVCAGGQPGCVPWNIFQDGGVTQDQLNYLYLLGTGTGNNSLRTIHGDITGELGKYGIKMPTAHDGIGVNVGFEHRKETVQYVPDAAFNSGQLSGLGGTEAPVNNSIGVGEEFIEIRAPLLQDLPLAKDLVLGLGGRHSLYTSSGSTNTYKVDLQYSPIEDIRFRGSWQRAIRAPSVSELYNQQSIGQAALGNDICAPTQDNNGNNVPPTYTLAQCLNTLKSLNKGAGPTPAQVAEFTALYNAGVSGVGNQIPQAVSGQLAQVIGGQPGLQPEVARSVTFGVAFQPTAIPKLTGSIDWWQIRVDGAVGTYPAFVLQNNCATTGNPFYCSQIVRQPGFFYGLNGTIPAGGYILQLNYNIASLLYSGVDVQTNYKMDLPAGFGSLDWQLVGSYSQHVSTQPLPGGGSYDCAGLWGSTCQTVNPRWRHTLRTTWVTPWNVDASIAWRFIGKVGQDNNDPNPLLFGATYSGGFDFFDQQLPNVSYFDVAATWHVQKWLDVRAGIDNLFDRDPPIITNPSLQGGGEANTFATYDLLGRQVYVAFTAKF